MTTGDVSENTPLLNNEPHQQDGAPAPKRGWLAFPTAYLIFVPLLANSFATIITITPEAQIYHTIVCQLWYAVYEPDGSRGRIPEERCSRPEIEKAFSTVAMIIQIVNSVLGFIAFSGSSYFSNKYGRKPVLAALMMCTVMAATCFLAAIGTPNEYPNAQAVFLIGSIFFDSIGQMYAVRLVCNMYVVDLVAEDERTSVLSLAIGVSVLGQAPTYWLGGYIMEHSSNVSTVFAWKLCVAATGALFTILVLPESLPRARRDAITAEEAQDAVPGRSGFQRAWNGLKLFLKPLRLVKPTRHPQTGRRNFRLLTLATLQAINAFGVGYLGPMLFVTLIARLHMKASDLGIVLSGFAFASFLWLSLAMPALVKFLRPTVARGSAEPESEHDKFDKYVAFVSSFAESLGFVLLGLSNARYQLILSMVVVAIGQGLGPTFRSLTVASVSSTHSAEALSLLSIFFAVGNLLSPVVFGPILTANINTHPQAVFWIASAVLFLHGVLVLLIRESDRYVSSDSQSQSNRARSPTS